MSSNFKCVLVFRQLIFVDTLFLKIENIFENLLFSFKFDNQL